MKKILMERNQSLVHEWILNLRLHPAAGVEAGLARWGESSQQHVLQAMRCIPIIISITECPLTR